MRAANPVIIRKGDATWIEQGANRIILDDEQISELIADLGGQPTKPVRMAATTQPAPPVSRTVPATSTVGMQRRPALRLLPGARETVYIESGIAARSGEATLVNRVTGESMDGIEHQVLDPKGMRLTLGPLPEGTQARLRVRFATADGYSVYLRIDVDVFE